jgi:hypothetical protein
MLLRWSRARLALTLRLRCQLDVVDEVPEQSGERSGPMH